ncbi:MAG: signal peptidase II [Bacteroidia bacterium]|nr:signal peptidase II [Bacteroidia bacterium]MDW8158711.1 signal peptidase II [Bacteroidia bacterium]
MLNTLKPVYKYYAVSLLVVFLDQITKIAVKLNMNVGDEIPIVGNFFKIHFIENPGAAFGVTIDKFFDGLSPEFAKLILSLFSLLAVGGIVYFLHQVVHRKNNLPLWISLILGGAIGNIIDRVFYGIWFAEINEYEGGFLYGRVVDMFYIDIWQGTLPESIPLVGGTYLFLWPIFNIADAAISVGIVFILIFQKQYFQNLELLQQEKSASLDSSKSLKIPQENPNS